MADIKLSIFNESTALSDAQVQSIIDALQTQVSEHFAPAWGIGADLAFYPKLQSPPPGSWWLVFLDNSDQAGALGYHDLTPDGLPIGKVFAQSDLDNHLSWSITASHELLEMLGDPEINLTTFIEDSGTSGKLYAREVCDAVEDDQYGYQINGTAVSDFVLPAYFEPSLALKNPAYDYCGHLHSPVPSLLSGGYIGAFDITHGTGWNQITSPTEGQPHRGHLRAPIPGGRANRRRRPRHEWKVSSHRPTDPKDPRLVPMAVQPRLVPM